MPSTEDTLIWSQSNCVLCISVSFTLLTPISGILMAWFMSFSLHADTNIRIRSYRFNTHLNMRKCCTDLPNVATVSAVRMKSVPVSNTGERTTVTRTHGGQASETQTHMHFSHTGTSRCSLNGSNLKKGSPSPSISGQHIINSRKWWCKVFHLCLQRNTSR